MSILKPTPRQTLWTMFVLQVVFSLGLFLAAIYVHDRENKLIVGQREMNTFGEQSRKHIQTEGDIVRLRATALKSQHYVDLTWDEAIAMAQWSDVVIWSFFGSSIGIAIVGGYTVYAYRVRKTQPNKSLQPTATAPTVLTEP